MWSKTFIKRSTISAGQMEKFWQMVDKGLINGENFADFLSHPSRFSRDLPATEVRNSESVIDNHQVIKLKGLSPPVKSDGVTRTTRQARLPIPSSSQEIEEIFEQQVMRLLQLGYPSAVRGRSLSDSEFVAKYIDPLRSKLVDIQGVIDPSRPILVIAVSRKVVPLYKQMKLIERGRKTKNSRFKDSDIAESKEGILPGNVWIATNLVLTTVTGLKSESLKSSSPRPRAVIEEGLGVMATNFSALNGREFAFMSSIYNKAYMMCLKRANRQDGKDYGYELGCCRPDNLRKYELPSCENRIGPNG